MAEVIVLGSAGAIPDARRDNTYLAVRDGTEVILVDCGGSPIQRLRQAGLDPLSVKAIILTHHHPDHIYGLPALQLGMWLLGRQEDLHIYGPLKAVAAVAALVDAMDTRDWPNLFRIVFHAVQLTEKWPVFETERFKVLATPVAHMVACIALRFEVKMTASTMVYSSDTEPCDSLVRLGQGADLLLHEATGEERGHSSPAQAGTVAQQMAAKSLVLIHLPPDLGDGTSWREQALSTFHGPVTVANDLDRFEW